MGSLIASLSRRLGIVAVVAASLMVSGVFVGLLSVDASSWVLVPMFDAPEGVSAHDLRGHRVFVVRTGDSFLALDGRSTHMRANLVWWCPEEQVFLEPMFGIRYDRSGRVVRPSPAARGMARYATRQDAHGLWVDLRGLEPGPHGDREPGIGPSFAWTSTSCSDRIP